MAMGEEVKVQDHNSHPWHYHHSLHRPHTHRSEFMRVTPCEACNYAMEAVCITIEALILLFHLCRGVVPVIPPWQRQLVFVDAEVDDRYVLDCS